MLTVAALAERVCARYGLKAQVGWPEEIERAASRLGRERACTSAEVLARGLDDPQWLATLAGRLTIGETYFLRQAGHFDCLTEFLAQRLNRAPEELPLRLLSAGCATGEEPYSAAIVLYRALGPQALERVDITACDISEQALLQATRGIFRPWSFRGAPGWLLADYFTGLADGGFKIMDRILSAVRFRHQSVGEQLETTRTASLDVILFRNVAIYLQQEALDRLYAGMHGVLKQDGLLLLGPADPMPPATHFARLRAAGIYRRVDPAASGSLKDRLPWSQRCVGRRVVRPFSSQRQALFGPQEDRTLATKAGQLGPGDSRPKTAQSSKPSPDDALRLGDNGELEQACRLASHLVAKDPLNAAAYLVRGQILLAAGDAETAVADLRRALFLAPRDVIARYWYAQALCQLSESAQCIKQVREVLRILAGIPEDFLLCDGETRAGELRRAAELTTEGLK